MSEPLLQHGVTLAAKHAHEAEPEQTVLVFDDDATGQQIDFDLRGSDEEVRARYASDHVSGHGPAEPRGRDRPKLWVTAREVTLLPRQWEWLNAQPGGASVTLRRLVEEARRREQENGRSAPRCSLCVHGGDGSRSAALCRSLSKQPGKPQVDTFR
jgi:hypothetical protein